MPDDHEELDIFNSEGRRIGHAKRSVIHGDPSLVHRVVHVLVFNSEGKLLLQKRSKNKDVAPGKWDTSVGGHISPGEDIHSAAEREMKEELGIKGCQLRYLYEHLFSNHIETERVSTFTCVYDGEVAFSRNEIDETRHWSLREIEENLGRGIFSNHFEAEIKTYLDIQETS